MQGSRERLRKNLKGEVLFVLIKVLFFSIILAGVFVSFFGVVRLDDNSMRPALKGGDLVIYSRMRRSYRVSEVVVVKTKKGVQLRRVIARAHDRVTIDDRGLVINGYPQKEENIYERTFMSSKGIRFPLKVGRNGYFVLADRRQSGEDSRIYGVVNRKDIRGTVVAVIRVRDF